MATLRVIEMKFVWQERDAYLAPDSNDKFVWYISALIDESGRRLTTLQAIPATWFMNPQPTTDRLTIHVGAGVLKLP